MSKNGHRRDATRTLALELALERQLIEDVRRAPIPVRAQALAWLRRWRRRPERIFWEVQPTGGRRLV